MKKPMPEHTTTTTAFTWEVWFATPTGEPIYRYRHGLSAIAARSWADAWITEPPADTPSEGTFVVVRATTTTTLTLEG